MNTIDNATTEQIANMLIAPVVKLYKRCARNHHEQCPGSFETWSICSCQCHAGVSDMRAAVTCADKVEAVAAAVAIVATPKPAKVKASGLSTKTDKYAKWANAIVAKNARAEAAWREVQAAKGLFLWKEERFTSRFDGPAIGKRCADCNIPMHLSYGSHDGRCNQCNVKRGVMEYVPNYKNVPEARLALVR